MNAAAVSLLSALVIPDGTALASWLGLIMPPDSTMASICATTSTAATS
jgi:hypothetical protein